MIELECKSVWFYSTEDETAFFSWTKSIPAVVSVIGRGQSIFISLKSRTISDASLRALLGLFKRYKISMRQLAQFENVRNRAWFRNSEAFWSRSVFGSAEPTVPLDAPATASRRRSSK